ncbi:MAG: hypothetical protein RLZZ434_976, partial [Pseudomonadota bacterium]
MAILQYDVEMRADFRYNSLILKREE